MRIGGSGSVSITGRPWESIARAQTFVVFDTPPTVAAEYSKIQILNPAGSGVVVYVTRIAQWGSTFAEVCQDDTGLATESTVEASKSLGAAAPKAEVRYDSEGTLNTPVLMRLESGAATNPNFTPFDEGPWELAEGKGLLVQRPGVNATMPVGFEWAEVEV